MDSPSKVSPNMRLIMEFLFVVIMTVYERATRAHADRSGHQ